MNENRETCITFRSSPTSTKFSLPHNVTTQYEDKAKLDALTRKTGQKLPPTQRGFVLLRDRQKRDRDFLYVVVKFI